METNDAINTLSPQEAFRMMNDGETVILIDTLPPDRYQSIHLPQAKNACVFEVAFIDHVTAIADDTRARIIVYGSSDKSFDAVTAAKKLRHHGYQHIHVLQGGLESWRSAGLPLEGLEIDRPCNPKTIVQLDDRSYTVDTEQSIIEWRGRNPNTTHFGTVKLAGGHLEITRGTMTGSLDIDMHSIENINLRGDSLQQVLLDHLKSDDFFLTALFPKARLVIESAQPVPEPFASIPNYAIAGTLELRGMKEPQEFMATVATDAHNTLTIESHFDIDRTRWGILYGSARFFEHLGMHMVFDLISVQLRIVARP